MKVLNLYAGIGGNRKLWKDVEVTAVEMREDIAAVYADYFPQDKIVIGDAHQYLLDHYSEFDAVWGSPPCPTHSRLNTTMVAMGKKPSYPDMKLYQEIIFLKQWFKGVWFIENVIPYYPPLYPATIIDRHLFWSNVPLTPFKPMTKKVPHEHAKISDIEIAYGYDLSKYKIENKLKVLRNCVHPETGLHILNCARNITTKQKTTQTDLISMFQENCQHKWVTGTKYTHCATCGKHY